MGFEELLDFYRASSTKSKALLWGVAGLVVIAIFDFALRLRLSDLVDATESLASVFTVIAIVIGGFWTYLLFIRTRQRFPRASLEHRIVYKLIDDDKALLRVTLTLTNQGEVLLKPVSGVIRVQQMVPWPTVVLEADPGHEDPIQEGDTEVAWPLMKEYEFFEDFDREIEPSEPDEIHFDFVIEGWVETILVYTYIGNEQKRGRNIGWGLTTVHDLHSNGGA